MDNKHSKFITGALVGLGLGLLFVQAESESKKEFKSSLNKLLEAVKEIDVSKTKAVFMKRLNDIKDELSGLSYDTRVSLAKIKINHIKDTCLELEAIANDNNCLKILETAKEVRLRAEGILEELSSNHVKKKAVVKKAVVKKRGRKKI